MRRRTLLQWLALSLVFVMLFTLTVSPLGPVTVLAEESQQEAIPTTIQRYTPITNDCWASNGDGTFSVVLFEGLQRSEDPNDRSLQFRNGGDGPLGEGQIAAFDYAIMAEAGFVMTVEFTGGRPAMQIADPTWWPAGWQAGTAYAPGVRTFTTEQILNSTEAWGEDPFSIPNVAGIQQIELHGSNSWEYEGGPTYVTRIIITIGIADVELTEDAILINNRTTGMIARPTMNDDGTESLVIFQGRRTAEAGNETVFHTRWHDSTDYPCDDTIAYFNRSLLGRPVFYMDIEYTGQTPYIETQRNDGVWWPNGHAFGTSVSEGHVRFSAEQIFNATEAFGSDPYVTDVDDLLFMRPRGFDWLGEIIITRITLTYTWVEADDFETIELFSGQASQDPSTNEDFWFTLRDLGDRNNYFDTAETVPVGNRFGMSKVNPGRADTQFTISYSGSDGIYFALYNPLSGDLVSSPLLSGDGSVTVTNEDITNLRLQLNELYTAFTNNGLAYQQRSMPASHVVFKIGPANAVIENVSISYMPGPWDAAYVEIDNLREGRIDPRTAEDGGYRFDLFRGRRYIHGSNPVNSHIFEPNRPGQNLSYNLLYGNVMNEYFAWWDRVEWHEENGEAVITGGGASVLTEPGAMIFIEYDEEVGPPTFWVRTWRTGYWPEVQIPYTQVAPGVRSYMGMDVATREINGYPWLLDDIHNIGLMQLRGTAVVTRITIMYGMEAPLAEGGNLAILPGAEQTLIIGDTTSFHPIFDPVHASDVSLLWESSDPAVLAIADNTARPARIEAVGEGEAYISLTATCNISGVVQTAVSAQVTVVAGFAVTGITVRPLNLTMPRNADTWLTATVLPYYSSDQRVEWTVEGDAVEIIAERAGSGYNFSHTRHAQIRAVSPGTATVRVTTNEGDFVAETTVTVTAQEEGLVPFNIFSGWQPGIPGGVPNVYNVHSIIDPADFGNGYEDATPAIRAAVVAAGAIATAENPQVVFLLPGVFLLDGTLHLDQSHVVLRGSGPCETGENGTLLISPQVEFGTAGTTRIAIGGGTAGGHLPNYDGVAVHRLLEDALMGDMSITVENASAFNPGDILILDRLADDYGDITGRSGGTEWRVGYYQGGFMMRRNAPGGYLGPASPEGHRSVKQYVEVARVSGNTLHLRNAINFDFPVSMSGRNLYPEVWNTNAHNHRNIGLENVQVHFTAGGEWWNPSGIVLNAASSFSWVRNIVSYGRGSNESVAAGDTGFRGTHIEMFGFRNEVRDNFIHYSADQRPGGNTYGIRVWGTGGLIENNVIDQLNKPILGTATGGGNVYAHNIIPNAILADGDGRHDQMTPWQETSITTSHGGHSHSDLLEGNFGANMSTGGGTHGNASQMVFFRNHAWGRNWNRTGYGTPQTTGHNLRGIGVPAMNGAHASIGNVLLTPENVNAFVHRVWSHEGAGQALRAYYIGGGDGGYALNLFHWQHDFNYSSYEVLNRTDNAAPLPNSLFRNTAPDFFDGYVWPPVNPYGTSSAARVGGLPAQSRFLNAKSLSVASDSAVEIEAFGTVTVPISTEGIDGSFRVFLNGAPSSVTATNVTVSGNQGNLTLRAGATTPAGQYFVTVMINGVISNTFVLNVSVNPDMVVYGLQIGSYDIMDLLQGELVLNMEEMHPVLVDNRTLIPLQYIADLLDATTAWDRDNQVATITVGSQVLNLTIGELIPGLDVPAQIINNRTMIPLRFIVEFFDAHADWNPITRTIEIIIL